MTRSHKVSSISCGSGIAFVQEKVDHENSSSSDVSEPACFVRFRVDSWIAFGDEKNNPRNHTKKKSTLRSGFEKRPVATLPVL